MLNWFWKLLGYKEQISSSDQEQTLLADERRRMALTLAERRQDASTRIAQREAERKNRQSTSGDSTATDPYVPIIFSNGSLTASVDPIIHPIPVDNSLTFHGGDFGGGGAGSSWDSPVSSTDSSSCDSGSRGGGSNGGCD